MLAKRTEILSKIKPYSKCCLLRHPLRSLMCGYTGWQLDNFRRVDDLSEMLRTLKCGLLNIKSYIAGYNHKENPLFIVGYSIFADVCRQLYKILKPRQFTFMIGHGDNFYTVKKFTIDEIEYSLKSVLCKYDCYKGFDLLYYYIVNIFSGDLEEWDNITNNILVFPDLVVDDLYIDHNNIRRYLEFYDIAIEGSNVTKHITEVKETFQKRTIIYSKTQKLIPYDPLQFGLFPLQLYLENPKTPNKGLRDYKKICNRQEKNRISYDMYYG